MHANTPRKHGEQLIFAGVLIVRIDATVWLHNALYIYNQGGQLSRDEDFMTSKGNPSGNISAF
jgi:hypothetical protein